MVFRVSALCGLLLSALPAAADVFTFETPSGNIDCVVGVGGDSSDITCTIYERSGPPARPRPGSCRGTWGHSFEMFSRGAVRMICDGPLRNGSAQEIAPYGVTGAPGGFECTSERTGLTCRNEDGHGFFLSRRAQRVF
ncbi:DUF6636 domain-containing protein [Litorisediminicola beolgyonensis]|uniref:DUF6636 domain-containing protein n=1 Tax=Litorisediminicola beolgyonensis TaxID=1173614 RepID=A0ABW3ZN66_9RHOB